MRPSDDPRNENTAEPVDWQDNWLSNFFAAASLKFVPSWCQENEHHWTNRLSDYLYTSCPCCKLFRGIVLGLVASSLFWIAVILTVVLISGREQ